MANGLEKIKTTKFRTFPLNNSDEISVENAGTVAKATVQYEKRH
jgi:hypothetical protein